MMLKDGQLLRCIVDSSSPYLSYDKNYEVFIDPVRSPRPFIYDDKDIVFSPKDFSVYFELVNEYIGEPDSIINNTGSNPTPDYYGAACKCGRKMDWYVIGDAYRKGKGEAWSHACKKLLRAGEGHKTLEKDINEVIDTLNRWKEQLEENK